VVLHTEVVVAVAYTYYRKNNKTFVEFSTAKGRVGFKEGQGARPRSEDWPPAAPSPSPNEIFGECK